MLIRWFITTEQEQTRISINYNVGKRQQILFLSPSSPLRRSTPKKFSTIFHKKKMNYLFSLGVKQEPFGVCVSVSDIFHRSRKKLFSVSRTQNEKLCKKIAITHLSALKRHLSWKLIASYKRANLLFLSPMVMFDVDKFSSPTHSSHSTKA